MQPTYTVILVMGVAGSGKSTVGQAIAKAFGAVFLEGDQFHSPGNLAKMASGDPLDDADRWPWLEALADAMTLHLELDQRVVVACSALKASYRQRLLADRDGVLTVYLHGDFATIRARLAARTGHFMKEPMLRSQFNILEPPDDALDIDVALPVATIVETVLQRLSCTRTKT